VHIVARSMSGALRTVINIGGGAALSQAVVMLATPFLGRMYGPQEYALFGLTTSYISILAVIMCLRMDQAILVARGDEEAKKLVFLANKLSIIALTASLFITALLWLFVHNFSYYYFLIPIVAFASAGMNINQQFQLKFGKSREIARMLVVRALMVVTFQVVFYYSLKGINGLIVGQLVGFVLGLILTSLWVRRNIGEVPTFSMKELMLKYSDFPRHNTPHAIFSAMSLNLPSIAFGMMFPLHLVGMYIMSEKILKLPVSIVSQAVRQTMVTTFSQHHPADVVFKMLVKSTLYMLLLICIPAAVVFMWGADVFAFVLGESWRYAGDVSSIVMIWALFVFINAPSAAYIISVRKSDVLAKGQLIDLLGKATLLMVMYIFGFEFMSAVLVLSVYSSVYNVFVVWYSMRSASRAKVF
jgi:lipopolysaccharide exporter